MAFIIWVAERDGGGLVYFRSFFSSSSWTDVRLKLFMLITERLWPEGRILKELQVMGEVKQFQPSLLPPLKPGFLCQRAEAPACFLASLLEGVRFFHLIAGMGRWGVLLSGAQTQELLVQMQRAGCDMHLPKAERNVTHRNFFCQSNSTTFRDREQILMR